MLLFNAYQLAFVLPRYREYMQTIESIPLHEIIFFDNVDNLSTVEHFEKSSTV